MLRLLLDWHVIWRWQKVRQAGVDRDVADIVCVRLVSMSQTLVLSFRLCPESRRLKLMSLFQAVVVEDTDLSASCCLIWVGAIETFPPLHRPFYWAPDVHVIWCRCDPLLPSDKLRTPHWQIADLQDVTQPEGVNLNVLQKSAKHNFYLFASNCFTRVCVL